MIKLARLQCCACKRLLYETSFSRAARTSTGYQSQCKECSRERLANWQKQNRERCVGYTRTYVTKFPDRVRASAAKRQGIIHADINAWFSEQLRIQGGKCAVSVCEVRHTDEKPLFMDHCHTTGRPRWLLCSTCNLILESGDADRIARLKAIAALGESL